MVLKVHIVDLVLNLTYRLVYQKKMYSGYLSGVEITGRLLNFWVCVWCREYRQINRYLVICVVYSLQVDYLISGYMYGRVYRQIIRYLGICLVQRLQVDYQISGYMSGIEITGRLSDIWVYVQCIVYRQIIRYLGICLVQRLQVDFQISGYVSGVLLQADYQICR